MTSILPLVLGTFLLSSNAGPARGKLVFTVDDGPHRYATPHLLDLFDTYGIRATWFVAGFHLPHPKSQYWLRQIVRRGHLLGNHLWTHKSPCKTLTVVEVAKELRRNERRVLRLLRGPWHKYRSQMRRWYRPPYGHRCKAVRALMRRERYSTRMWDVPDTGPVLRLAKWIRARWRRGKRTVILWHHRWRKLRDLLAQLEKWGIVKRRKT